MEHIKYIYTREMDEMTRALPDAERLEVADAINLYALHDKTMVLTPLAQGVFNAVKVYLDAQKKKEADIKAKRSKSGASHRGNQYSKGENGTSVPKCLKIKELRGDSQECKESGTNGTSVPNLLNISQLQQMEQVFQNGTSVPNSLKANELEENGTSVPNPSSSSSSSSSLDNPYNNINNINSLPHNAHTRMREWMGDNTETLTRICIRNGLIKESKTKEEMLQIIEPYIDLFLDSEMVRDDIERGYERDVKNHFINWIRNYIEKNGNNKNSARGLGRNVHQPPKDEEYW